jgi:hypothetical protein
VRGSYRSIYTACALLGALSSSACLVVSLQPLYDDASVVFEEALVGRWEDADDQISATVERGDWKSYKISYTDRSSTRPLNGNLTSVENVLFLDLTELRGSDPGPYLVPVHGIFRVTLDDDTLTATPLDYGWFTRAVAQKTGGRLNLALDDRRNVVMTSPTDEIRRWLVRPPLPAFGTAMTFVRKAEKGP